MGNTLVLFYQNRVKKNWKIAFFSAFIIGMLVHMYKFTNNFPFLDSYYNMYTSQDMLASGRWFLGVACSISSYFDLPWLIGIISVFFIACTAAVVVEIFEIESPCLIVVSAGLLVSYPAITETMFFEYTADGYMIAMLLSALSVYFSSIEKCQNWKNCGVSIVLLCLTCGIYQAYISFAFILSVCYLMGQILCERQQIHKQLRWIACQILIYITALGLYYLIWKLRMHISGITANTYQGISEMGGISVESVLSSVRRILQEFKMYLLERIPWHQGWTIYSALNVMTCAAFGGIVLWAIVKRKIYRSPLELLLVMICVAAVPFGSYVIYFISPGVNYCARMLQSVVLMFIFTGVLFDRLVTVRYKDFVLLLLTAVLINNALMANICYTHMHRFYEKSSATMAEIAARIHMEDDGQVKYVAFMGMLDPMDEDADIDNSQLGMVGPLKLVSKTQILYHEHIYLFLSQYTEFTLSYYRSTGELFPKQEISQNAPVPAGFEFRFPLSDEQHRYEVLSSPEVSAMGIWPSRDAVRRIGDTIVIKLSEG